MSLQRRLLHNFQGFSERPVIKCGNSVFSYADLADYGLKICRHIVAKSITDSCIAISVDDPVRHIAAILGVIWSGNYYVSVTPENHNFFRLQNKLPLHAVIYSSIVVHERIPGPKYFDLENILQTESAELRYLETAGYPEENPICAFCTSGSSGPPKIVVHTAKNVLNDSLRQVEDNEIRQSDTIDFLFSFAFSASLACIFPALLAGACIAIFDVRKYGMASLSHFWKNTGVTFSSLSVSSFRALCRLNENLKDVSTLRFLSLGAEKVLEDDIGLFRQKFNKNTVLQVAYATTETRTIAEYKIRNGDPDTGFTGSVGCAVKDREIHIISDSGEALPHLVVGEIVVKSAFIAAEYLNDPGQTAEAFCNNDGEIIYRTGDLGYIDEHGHLFYVGRKGPDIKINGMKVDIFSMEKEIEKMTGIQAARVLMNSDDVSRGLTACIQATIDVDFNQIKKRLAALFPLSHVPSSFLLMKEFPLTATGKTDQVALQHFIDEQINNDRKQPAKPTQPDGKDRLTTLVGICNEILNINNTQPVSHFFYDLGGDSLQAMICVAEMEKRLQIAIPNHALFLCKNMANLDKYLTYDLFIHSVHQVRLNSYIAGRRTLYFIDYYHGRDNYKNFTQTALSDHFNLICLYYDIFSIGYSENEPVSIMAEMQKLIGESKDAVVAGFSFNGYPAFQLAAAAPGVVTAVLLDTPNYFEYGPYRSQKKSEVLKALLRGIFIGKDFLLPFFAIKCILQQKHSGSDTTEQKSVALPGIRRYLNTITNNQLQANCLFIKASRGHFRNHRHGYNWKKYVSGDFKLVNLRASHLELLSEKSAQKIAHHILANV